MKSLSLKLEVQIFEETEEVTAKLNRTRNRYINEAVHFYNLFNKKRLLRKQLVKESAAGMVDAMEVLKEFEALVDED